MDYKVRLVTTKPNYGGAGGGSFVRSRAVTAVRRAAWRSSTAVRWQVFWEPRGLRAPPRRPCQESGKNCGLFRRLATEMGTDEATIRAALDRGELPLPRRLRWAWPREARSEILEGV